MWLARVCAAARPLAFAVLPRGSSWAGASRQFGTAGLDLPVSRCRSAGAVGAAARPGGCWGVPHGSTVPRTLLPALSLLPPWGSAGWHSSGRAPHAPALLRHLSGCLHVLGLPLSILLRWPAPATALPASQAPTYKHNLYCTQRWVFFHRKRY